MVEGGYAQEGEGKKRKTKKSEDFVQDKGGKLEKIKEKKGRRETGEGKGNKSMKMDDERFGFGAR